MLVNSILFLRRFFDNNLIKLVALWLIAIIIDNYYVINLDSPPDWDQGYHLSNTFKMFNIIDNHYLNIHEKFSNILDVTDSYRGPLTYFLSSLILKINNSYKFAYLSNHVFVLITILSIYKLGEIYKSTNVGLWASCIYLFSPLVIIQRGQYLIDISLTSFITLSTLVLTYWFKSKNNNSIFAMLSGFCLGLTFLVKPTALITIGIPLIILFFKKYIKKVEEITFYKDIFIFIFIFIIVIFPWFSKHWITIITSTLNAWKWGINYQEGLDANTIEGWLFYLQKLPKIIGISNFIALLIFIIFNILDRKDNNNIFKINNINKWFILFIFNFYIIASVMSTKDIRFILPIYPIICLYFADIINKKTKRYFFFILKNAIFSLSIILTLILFINNISLQFKKVSNNNNWYHKEIIESIKNDSPMLSSTLAVLPDTKEINTFNLEAEAVKQGEHVAVRQVVSNIKTYKNDLKYFDWFLIKSGDQGIMTNKSKELLSNYLLVNDSFFIYKKWLLPDNTDLLLMRRKELNTEISEINCDFVSPKINIKKLKNGINIELFAKGSLFDSSKLLIDLENKFEKHKINIAIGQGQINNIERNKKCYKLSQNISYPLKANDKFKSNTQLITKKNILINLLSDYSFSIEKIDDKITEYILMENKIDKVNELGSYLKNGNFDKIFNLIGVLNQSDPIQSYFGDAESIFKERYKQKNDIKYLYNILICQIMNKDIKAANITLDKIIKEDNNNGNNYLTKAIVSIYEFKLKKARESINKLEYNKLTRSAQTDKYKNYVDGFINIFEFKFKEGLSKFS